MILKISTNFALSSKKRKLKKFGKHHIGKVGIDYIGKLIEEHIPQKTFEELDKPLFVCLTNMGTGNDEIISTGAILPPLKATAAIPIKYEEQHINGATYIDGGILNNLPVEPLHDRCATVVGISVNPIEEKTGKLKLRDKVVRLIDLVVNENETRRIELCDFHLEVPGLGAYDLEEYDKVQEIYDLGYQSAKVFIDEKIVLCQPLKFGISEQQEGIMKNMGLAAIKKYVCNCPYYCIQF